MNLKWKKCEQGQVFHLKENDFLVYAREFVSGKGYQGGLTNSLILNFKKPPYKKENPPEWKHREKAVKQFAKEIELLLRSIKRAVLTAIPSSNKKDHPKYDNRFEDLFIEILKSHPEWIIEWPVEIKENIEPSHISKEKNPDVLKKNYFWKGFKNKEPEALYIFDDIMTTGAHFRAMSDFLRENQYKGKIIGICWAKAVAPPPDPEELKEIKFVLKK